MVLSRAYNWTPHPSERLPCGSISTIRTERPRSARAEPRERVVVVLPEPPFWFAIAIVLATGYLQHHFIILYGCEPIVLYCIASWPGCQCHPNPAIEMSAK